MFLSELSSLRSQSSHRGSRPSGAAWRSSQQRGAAPARACDCRATPLSPPGGGKGFPPPPPPPPPTCLGIFQIPRQLLIEEIGSANLFELLGHCLPFGQD